MICGNPKPRNLRITYRILKDCDLSIRNREGQTIIHQAILRKCPGEFVATLLRYGANIALRDVNGQTARDLAEGLGLIKYVNVIDEFVYNTLRTADTEISADRLDTWICQGYEHIVDVSETDEVFSTRETKNILAARKILDSVKGKQVRTKSELQLI